MKKLILTLVFTLSLVSGFSTVSASVLSNTASATSATTGTYTVRVNENGAIWVYVYEQDGTFIGKYIETLN